MGQLANRFGKVGAKGESGENYLYEVLKNQYTVSDYRTDMVMQTQGIDFGIKKPEWRREYTLDVKNTLYIEKNNEYIAFKIELECNKQPGWFFTSKADRIYHTNAYMGKYLYYNLDEMRYYVNKKLIAQDTSTFKILEYNGDILLQFQITNAKHDKPVSTLY
jgi:hypothetical protein